MLVPTNLPKLIASRYRPIRLIASGGMGAVYEVEHTRTGEHLALKLLLASADPSAETIERFKREARASARIKSEHVVRVTDADVAPELEGAPFLVMELLDGMDLERAATAFPPTPETVVAWLRPVALAIDKAHGLGIIHRDLKPENLFLATVEGGRAIVKVLDFGIAKMLEDGTGVTGSGQLLGTPKYMAPEQASPNTKVTPATDRCALGLIAYRLLTGESYYQGGLMIILGQILHDELQPPSRFSPRLSGAFDTWFLKACHRDPQQRFASASDQIQALAEALGLPKLESEPSPIAIEVRGSKPEGGPRAHLTATLAVVLGLFAAASLAVLVLRGKSGNHVPGTTQPASVPPVAPALPSPPPPLAEPSRPGTASPLSPPEAPTLTSASTTTRSGHPPERPHAVPRQARNARSVAGMVPAMERTGPKKAGAEVAGMEKVDPYADQK